MKRDSKSWFKKDLQKICSFFGNFVGFQWIFSRSVSVSLINECVQWEVLLYQMQQQRFYEIFRVNLISKLRWEKFAEMYMKAMDVGCNENTRSSGGSIRAWISLLKSTCTAVIRKYIWIFEDLAVGFWQPDQDKKHHHEASLRRGFLNIKVDYNF